MLTKCRSIVLLLSLILASTSIAAVPDRYVEGTHYKMLNPAVPVADGGKIEVLGAFWYGCSHCYRFEPILADWVDSAASDVEFVRFPAIFGSLMKSHAQIFFTAEHLGVTDELHNSIYEALVLERKQLQTQNQIEALFVESGVDREDFSKAFNSFSVRTKLEQAHKRTENYNLTGTPSMVVNGKYMIITGESVRTQQEMLKVIDFLVEKERSTR